MSEPIKLQLCQDNNAGGLADIVKTLETNLQCNCDLDNWEPERSTGHSWVCRIHKTAIEKQNQKQ